MWTLRIICLIINFYPLVCLKDLYLMGFTSVTGPAWPGGGALIPAFEMAMRDINDRADILSGYRLNLLLRDTMSYFDSLCTQPSISGIYLTSNTPDNLSKPPASQPRFMTPHLWWETNIRQDSCCRHARQLMYPIHGKMPCSEIQKMNFLQCNAGKATDAMYEFLYTPPVKHMILGPVCSTEAEVQAQSAHMWNISHLSNAATSPVLSNRARFPNFFRINPADTRYNLARIEMLKTFNWKKVGTINVALDMFSSVSDDLADQLKDTDIHIVSQEIYERDPYLRVKNLKSKDVRIIFSMSYENQARLTLCAAYKEGLYGPKILWFFPGWYTDHWWRLDLDDVPCTVEEMDTVAEGHFLTGIYFRNQKEETGISGMTISEFDARFKQEPTYRPDLQLFEFLAVPTYDVVWASALALNCTDRVMKERGYTKTLDQFAYSDGNIGDIMVSCMYNTSFMGISGKVVFDRTGEPLRNIKIEQVRGLEKVTVGTYVLEEEERYINWHGEGIVWRGGVVPRDSTEIRLVQKTIPMYLYIVMATLSTGGIILALSLFLFNLSYREHVFVKLSSPNINNVLLLGCVFSYSSVYMTTYLEHTAVLCKLKHITFSIGFTMAFGAMFSKTWRVYRIFCNKKLLRVKIQDSQLIAIVVGMLGIISSILIVWEIVDPLYIRTLYLTNEEYTTGNDVMIRPFMLDCISNYYDYFLWTTCIVEGLFLAFGAFLAFETRKVKIEALNDSRLIGMCLYNVVILSLLGLTLSLLLDRQVALVYGLTSGFLIVGTTITQLIVFVPKIHSVLYPNSVGPSSDTDGNGLGTINTKRFESRIGTLKTSTTMPSTSG